MPEITMRELSRNPASLLSALGAGDEPLILTKHGKPFAAIVKLDEKVASDAIAEQVSRIANSSVAFRSLGQGPYEVPSNFESNKIKTRQGKCRLPIHLNWSDNAEYDWSKPSDRARIYEIVLREGAAKDIRKYVDYADMKKLWSTLYLPKPLRQLWEVSYPKLKVPA